MTSEKNQSITDQMIRALRSEARDAGDDDMVVICAHALGEHDSDTIDCVDFSVRLSPRLQGMTVDQARAECADIILENRAQYDWRSDA